MLQSLFRRPLKFASSSGLLLLLGVTLGVAPARADQVPPALTTLLTQLDQAASSQNLSGVLGYFSANFTGSDALNKDGLKSSLQSLWQQYPHLSYHTELIKWQPQRDGYTTKTRTTVTGADTVQGRLVNLHATIVSRQTIQNQQITSQTVLEEQSQVSFGDQPPTVQVQAPAQVRVGSTYPFDAIVQEPLGNSLLIGLATESPATPGKFLAPAPADLSLLDMGGLFKDGTAPGTPQTLWLSAVLLGEKGGVFITRQLDVGPLTKDHGS